MGSLERIIQRTGFILLRERTIGGGGGGVGGGGALVNTVMNLRVL
jgi:hypothetical protein